MKNSKFKGQKRWIILVQHSDGRNGAINILSARKNVEYIKNFLEDLSLMLPLCSEDILDSTKYTSPRIPYPAKRESDSDGRFVSITCGHNPHLEARRVEILGFENNGTKISWIPTYVHSGKRERTVTAILPLGVNIMDDETKQLTK